MPDTQVVKPELVQALATSITALINDAINEKLEGPAVLEKLEQMVSDALDDANIDNIIDDAITNIDWDAHMPDPFDNYRIRDRIQGLIDETVDDKLSDLPSPDMDLDNKLVEFMSSSAFELAVNEKVDKYMNNAAIKLLVYRAITEAKYQLTVVQPQ